MDIAANEGWLSTSLRLMHLVQMCVQGRWLSDSSLLTLPNLTIDHIEQLNKRLTRTARELGLKRVTCLAELLMAVEHDGRFLQSSLGKALSSQQISQV